MLRPVHLGLFIFFLIWKGWAMIRLQAQNLAATMVPRKLGHKIPP